ncbi:MAG TPA: PDZ domain-containing protein, partial [Longimicrobium sp.]|nr:PDZ domain-containing protein [Longimicrobium sp.]
AALLLLCATGEAAAQEGRTCSEGRPPAAQPGIGLFHCVGGWCEVFARRDHVTLHRFSSEPRVWRIAADGPAAGRLREGDVLVAVDGALVTSVEGGLRLANLAPGRPVRLRVRRAGRELEVEIVPRLGCGYPRLLVTTSAERPVP